MFEEYSRKPFDVKAVQVTLENVHDIANACKGRVEQAEYKVVGGVKMTLPCVMVPVPGANKDNEVAALIGHWVVEMKGNFRVYKPNQFNATFDKKIPMTDQPRPFLTSAQLQEEDLVSINEAFANVGGVLPNAMFSKNNYVRVSNTNSAQSGWQGYVSNIESEGLVRVKFSQGEEFFYLPSELEHVPAQETAGA